MKVNYQGQTVKVIRRCSRTTRIEYTNGTRDLVETELLFPQLLPFLPPPSYPPEQPTLEATQQKAFDLMEMHGLMGWRFRFDNSYRRAGLCRYEGQIITLSRYLVLLNPWTEVIDTILHEIAHALTPGDGHGELWKAKCREIGARPDQYYRPDLVKMPEGRFQASCPSCRRFYHRHSKPLAWNGWFCRPCGQERGPLKWKDTKDVRGMIDAGGIEGVDFPLEVE